MNYRKADIHDAAELAKLRKKQLTDEGGHCVDDIDKELISFFTDGLSDNTLIVWLAEEDGRIIATAGVCFFRYPPTFTNKTGKIAYITNVYTKDEYRRKGIASALLGLLMKDIENSGCGYIRLHSSLQGKRMYEKLGFTDAEGFMSLKLNCEEF